MAPAKLRWVLISLLLLLVGVSLAYLLRPIQELDFFWHLKTGEWIFEHRRLPAADPFSYTAAAVPTMAERFTLTSYWACQVLYYGAHAAGAWTGIVLLRFALAAALFTVIWKRRQGDAVVDAALLIVFAVTFLELYGMDRPQILSFIGFGLLLVLLDSLKKTSESRPGHPSPFPGYRRPLSLALVMIAWANVHGGFILGQATIVVYLVAEGVKFAHRSLRPVTSEAYRALLISGCAGLVGSLVNPNTYHALKTPFLQAGNEGQRVLITEYLSTVEALTQHKEYRVIIVWIIMLLASAAILSRPKTIDITEVVVLAIVGYFAFKALRYIAVFMIVAIPVIGRFLSQYGRPRWARAGAIACALVLVLVYARDERPEIRRLRTGDWVDRDIFPVAAADFILASGLSGNMYNAYNWGGYLIWRLAPERKVFADGRNINPGIHWQERIIGLAFEQPAQIAWKPLLDRYGVGYVVIPPTEGGYPTPLFERLARDPEWVTVFNKENAAVFARRSLLSR
jgi:hypothetical protein